MEIVERGDIFLYRPDRAPAAGEPSVAQTIGSVILALLSCDLLGIQTAFLRMLSLVAVGQDFVFF
ncbi:hypothetical protein MES5069_140016 [Mesorhizobium escarrei]|uniref:Uncharacterized protein n=1 Tax=Mesorhizobium escarrei TaxID=666018 RepID=A0ABN8JKZ1_9HYPH|nr:hypothetical protein MES5069_140016 [Mesorhizobium escarrei]